MIRSDHIIIRRFMKITLKGKVECLPAEMDKVSEAFAQMGGSWERLHKGSTDDLNLLKKMIREAHKRGVFTKREE